MSVRTGDVAGNMSGRGIDANDFDRYAVVAFAPAAIRADVERIHAVAPPCGLPTLPAHVTVKGSFVEPVDLAEIVERIDAITVTTPPIQIESDRVEISQSCSVVVLIHPNADLVALHTRLWDALHTLGTTDYAEESATNYRPHLTLVQAIQPTEVPAAMRVIEPWDTDYRFTAETISLVGRRGGTDWETLAEFVLRGAADE